MTAPHYNQQYLNVDPLKSAYHEGIVDHPDHKRSIMDKTTALLLIDMQYLDAARGFGVFADAEKAGMPLEAQEYYFNTLEQKVLPNVQRLLSIFREYELEVIHTRIMSLTRDGRDRSAGHKRLGLHAAPGSKESEFIPEVAPVGDEIVLSKTASGVFSSTNLHYILTNIGIKSLIVTGVYTNECVSSTIRAACDLGFTVTLVEDGCTTVTPVLQENTITVLKDRYARVLPTDEIIKEIEDLVR